VTSKIPTGAWTIERRAHKNLQAAARGPVLQNQELTNRIRRCRLAGNPTSQHRFAMNFNRTTSVAFICLPAFYYPRGDQLNASATPENSPIKVTRTMKATSPITKATMSALTEISTLAIKVTRTAVHGLPAGNPAPPGVSCFL
jgi:hypothetical protein